MALPHQLGVELEEEGEEEEADVHAVHIGIGGDDDVVVAEVLHAIVDVEGVVEEVELFVLIYLGLAYGDGVEGLASEAEDGLGLDVAALGDAAACGEALGDEDGALQTAGVVAVVVDVAVAQLGVVEAGFLAALFGQFLDAGDALALLLVALDLVEEYLCGLGVDVEVVVEVALEDVEDVGLQDGAGVAAVGGVGGEVRGAELCLGLCLKDGLLYADAEGADEALADVLGGVLFLVVELFDYFGVVFAEGALVGAAFGGVLAVDEAVVVVAALAVDVGEGGFEVLVLDVDDRVEGLAFDVVLKEVEEAVFGVVALVVIIEREAAVEVAVVPYAAFDVFVDEVEVAEEFAVGDELHEGAGGEEGVVGHIVDDAAVGHEAAL